MDDNRARRRPGLLRSLLWTMAALLTMSALVSIGSYLAKGPSLDPAASSFPARNDTAFPHPTPPDG